jgi:hypothetical protein
MFEPSDPSAAGDDASPVVDLVGLEHLPPTQLMAMLSRVHPDDVVDAYDLVEIAAACRRLKAWADGVEVEAAAALARHPVCHAPEAARTLGYGCSVLEADADASLVLVPDWHGQRATLGAGGDG